MKNIIFDARWINSGGIGRFCSEIMQAQSIFTSNKIEGSLDEALSPLDMFRISKITLGNKIYLSPGYNGPLFGTKRAIITVHDLMHLNFAQYSSLKNKIYYNCIVKRIVRNSPLVFTVSEFTKNEIAKWAKVDKSKIVVLYNGIDSEKFHCDVVPIVRERPYFLYVGNNKSHKNLERLIQAFHHSKLYDKCDLLLSCRSNELLDNLVRDLDLSKSVQFLNGIEEVELPSYYKGALATVVVSLYEGFCIPVVESMSVGTPVLTSNITAMPEIAENSALLVDPYSIDDISSNLSLLFNDQGLRDDLKNKGLERVKEFSWEKTRYSFEQAIFKNINS